MMTLSLAPRPLFFLAAFAASGICAASCDGDSGSDGGAGGNPACVIDVDTFKYDYDLKLARSAKNPGGFRAHNTPQFVAIGWDDNGFVESFEWALDMLQERKLHGTFYLTTTYISDGSTRADPSTLRELWQRAADEGHELGNHTQYHRDGVDFSESDWKDEIETAFHWLTAARSSADANADLGVGLTRKGIYGFRSPFLHYNDALFDELQQAGVWYDCSIEEGFQLDLDGTDFPWPYTLDQGSAGHDYMQANKFEARDFDITQHPGIIELPAYAVIVPPDSVADDYGIEPGLLARVRKNTPAYESGSDRLTGLDYNLWAEARLSKDEFVAVLKYNLDQRLKGNRAPFLFGAHTDFYRDNWLVDQVAPVEDRRAAIEEFLDYAATLDDVQIVTMKEVADYLREPRPIDCYQ